MEGVSAAFIVPLLVVFVNNHTVFYRQHRINRRIL